MMILFPDANFDDDAALERPAFSADAELVIARAQHVDDIADEIWRRASGLIVNIGVPIDQAVLDRLDQCRIITRAGVGFDHIDISPHYDGDTEQAIKQIQEKYGLQTDGIVGPLTKIALFNEKKSLSGPHITNR